ncbi:MAG: CPBP family intramembrane glutamic endopeptidase [Verrucomicrobiota bacterium]
MGLQISLLLVAAVISLAILRRAVPLALSNPNGFPEARWAWPEMTFTAGLVLFFLAMAAASAGRPAGRIDMGSLGTSLVLYVALVLLVVGFLMFRNFDLRETFGLDVRGWSWRVIAGWLVMFLPIVYFVQSLTYTFSAPDQAPQAIVDFLLKSSGWQARAAVFGIAVIAAPVTEELIFRGCLYGVLRKSCGRMMAIAISSVLFALIHGHLPSLPGLIVLAVGLALVYERCGSLWAPVSMHAAFNALTIVAAIFWPDLAK